LFSMLLCFCAIWLAPRRGDARYGIGKSWRDNTAAVPQGESLVGRWVLYNRGRALGWQNAKVLRASTAGRSSKYIVRLEGVADSGLELGVHLRQDQHSEIGSWLLWSEFDADGRRPRWYIRTRCACVLCRGQSTRSPPCALAWSTHTEDAKPPPRWGRGWRGGGDLGGGGRRGRGGWPECAVVVALPSP
jgi:hypothetical protein